MNQTRHWCSIAIFSALLAFGGGTAHAQAASDSATAQALFDHARQLIGDGDYAKACPQLEESQRIDPRSGTLLNLADCYEHTGRLASAWSSFIEAASLAKAAGNTERESGAKARAAALAPRLSSLVILIATTDTNTAGLEITRDGRNVGSAQWGLPLPADAGPHYVTASAPGRKPWRVDVAVKDGAATTTVNVPKLETLPVAASTATTTTAPRPADAPQSTSVPPEPSRHASGVPTSVIIGASVTGALAIGTVVTGVLYKGKQSEYDTANTALAGNREQLHTQTQTLGVANLALLGGTLVAAGVTLYLWVKAPSETVGASSNLRLHAAVGPGFSTFALAGDL